MPLAEQTNAHAVGSQDRDFGVGRDDARRFVGRDGARRCGVRRYDFDIALRAAARLREQATVRRFFAVVHGHLIDDARRIVDVTVRLTHHRRVANNLCRTRACLFYRFDAGLVLVILFLHALTQFLHERMVDRLMRTIELAGRRRRIGRPLASAHIRIIAMRLGPLDHISIGRDLDGVGLRGPHAIVVLHRIGIKRWWRIAGVLRLRRGRRYGGDQQSKAKCLGSGHGAHFKGPEILPTGALIGGGTGMSSDIVDHER